MNFTTETISCSGGTAVNKVSFNPALVTPTIATTYVNVPGDALNVRFFNTLGQIVKEIEVSTSTIDVTDLQTGVYFVGVTTREGESVGRIIKQ